jgi:hypothetical protein
VNECATNNGGCSQTCTNRPGGFTCSCSAYSSLAANGRDCTRESVCDVQADTLPSAAVEACPVKFSESWLSRIQSLLLGLHGTAVHSSCKD